jgi:UDP-2,3-diacylglucosamine pyrophosphatase LpxH
MSFNAYLIRFTRCITLIRLDKYINLIYNYGMTYKTIILFGDAHGNWNQIIDHQNKYDIQDSLYIALGDFGVGFNLEKDETLKLLQIRGQLAKSKNDLSIMRGNHDNPGYFVGQQYLIESNAKINFLEDYTIKTINNQTWLFVGGAVSVDRSLRTEGKNYWKDEIVKILSPEELAKLPTVDVLCTHSAPTFCNPIKPMKVGDMNGLIDQQLLTELNAERQYLDRLVEQVKPKQLFYGHFHHNDSGEYNGMTWRCLDGSHGDTPSVFFEYKSN